MTDDDAITAHYVHGTLAETIEKALRQAGIDPVRATTAELAGLDHFHARGAAATVALASRLELTPGQSVIDIGSGLGGPARLIAERYGATVAGIDLSAEYCRVAAWLSGLTGLSRRVSFRAASALALPFADASFDAGFSHSVAMNIADRARFFAEARRMLRPGGRFALAELALGTGAPPLYPVPWAERPETSFLLPPEVTGRLLETAGFEVLELRDGTAEAVADYARLRTRLAAEGPPIVGVHLILGARFKEMARNAARNVEEGRTVPIEIVSRRR